MYLLVPYVGVQEGKDVRFDPIAAYNGKAADYAAHRLVYAPEAMTAIVEITHLAPDWTLADIAAGTGHVAVHFVDCVTRLIAVEPNDEMRAQAVRLLGGHAGFEALPGKAEATTLPDSSIDLITIGQALHWFDIPAARREFARILKPGGWIGVIWNQLPGTDEPDVGGLFRGGRFRRLGFPMTVHETWEEYIRGVRSAAAAPRMNSPGYQEFERTQRELFDREATAGLLALCYTTKIAVGRLLSS